MALWHCDNCARQFEAPAGSVAHFHRCVDVIGAARRPRMPQRIPDLPPEPEVRQDLWHGLLRIVSKVSPLIDP